MSFLSGLKVFGQDVEKAFAWFGSPGGQKTVAAGETALETFVPASTPLVNLFNVWAQHAYTVEALAVAAGKATGTGVEKAEMVASAVTPAVLTYAQQAGLPAPTAAQIQKGNDAVIAFINAMTGSAPPA